MEDQVLFKNPREERRVDHREGAEACESDLMMLHLLDAEDNVNCDSGILSLQLSYETICICNVTMLLLLFAAVVGTQDWYNLKNKLRSINVARASCRIDHMHSVHVHFNTAESQSANMRRTQIRCVF